MFERILLAVDEAADTDAAMRAVTALARAFSSEVTVLHVRERTVTAAGTIEEESIPRSFAFGQAMARGLVERGVRASAVVESAEREQVAARILARAQEVSADLIVIGGHHPHSVRERVFGDLGKVLAHRARCPLLLMPSAASPAGEQALHGG